MNIQSLFSLGFRTMVLTRVANDLDSAMESCMKTASLLAVDDFGQPLPYEVEINLIGGVVKNFFDVIEDVKYEIVIRVFDDEDEKEKYLKRLNKPQI